MQRREFLKVSMASAVVATMKSQPSHADANRPTLPRRPYGRDGIELSVVGFGGIVVRDARPDHAARVVAEAVERGTNYFDVAPSYGDAEVKLGPALEPYRDEVFLACKTAQRGRDGAKAEFEQSLERLRTDHFDLYQLHALTEVEKDVDAAFAPDGVMPWLIEQKKTGRVRHIGFSAHSVSAAMAALERYDFDSILWPVNFAAYAKGDFGPQVVDRVVKQGAAVLALKAMAKGRWSSQDHPDRKRFSKCWYEPVWEPGEAALALRFTLGQPVTAALPPGEESLWRLAVDQALGGVEPLTAEQDARLVAMAQEVQPIFTNA